MRQQVFAIGTVCLFGAFWTCPGVASASQEPTTGAIPAVRPIQSLSLLGFSAEALAFAGASDEELQQARAFFGTKAQDVAFIVGLRELLAKRSSGRVAAEPNERSTADIQAEVDSRIAALRDAFVELFNEPSRAMLRQWIATEGHAVDAEYRVLVLDAQQWKQLESAVGAQRTATRTGEQLGDAEQALIHEMRSRPEVMAAVGRLAGRTGAARQVFRS